VPAPKPEPPSSEETRIIRRTPTGPIPAAAEPPRRADDAQTGIIRRAPTGAIPAVPDAAPTTHIPRSDDTALIQRAKSVEVAGSAPRSGPSSTTAVASCVVAMLSGWATLVVATDLITGWWNTDRLFCAAVGFLALVFAASTIIGVVLLLQRRPLGRYLIAVGAVVALLAFGGVFIAGAKIPWVVYAIPILPIASAVLALHPATKRWAAPDHSA
jgi:hypothetical protein